MNRKYFFERNLLALSRIDPSLCARLTMAETTLGNYKYLLSRDGKEIPAFVDKTGSARPLHSLIAPEKEAEKIVSTLAGVGYIVLMGLGGGFLAEAALKTENVKFVLVIDYNSNSIAELLCLRDFVPLISDPRFHILIDASGGEIEQYILNTYNPSVHDGIRAMPLRGRTDFDTEHFIPVRDAIKAAIDRVSTDFSVQAFFGKRWFSNIIRNIFTAEKQAGIFPPVKDAAICAAGPSLDLQLEIIKAEHSGFFLIATDTSLGSLLHAGIKPDAVISIDCQHISYYHFVGKDIQDIPLFLDLASPPILASCSSKTFFFSGGHPLNKYVSNYFRQFPSIDTSGANVTYAALSLAQKLGARNIKLFGADFSYPKGKLYTKNAYFYPFFTRKQNRFKSVESETTSFLIKIPSLERIETNTTWYYQTRPLKLYRESFEKKASSSNSKIIAVEGEGAPINIGQYPVKKENDNTVHLLSCGKSFCTAFEFLTDYRDKIAALPVPKDNNVELYCNKQNFAESLIWKTLLPAAAAIKQKEKNTSLPNLVKYVKDFSLSSIEMLLNNNKNS